MYQELLSDHSRVELVSEGKCTGITGLNDNFLTQKDESRCVTCLMVGVRNYGILMSDELHRDRVIVQAYISISPYGESLAQYRGTFFGYPLELRGSYGLTKHRIYFKELYQWLESNVPHVHSVHVKTVRSNVVLDGFNTSKHEALENICTNIRVEHQKDTALASINLREMIRNTFFLVTGVVTPLCTEREVRYSASEQKAHVNIFDTPREVPAEYAERLSMRLGIC